MNNALIVAKLQILVHLGCPGFQELASTKEYLQEVQGNVMSSYCQQNSFYLNVPYTKNTAQEIEDAENLAACLRRRAKQEEEENLRHVKCDKARDELREALGNPKPKLVTLTSGFISTIPASNTVTSSRNKAGK